MKIPEFLFRIINPMLKILLNTPLHGVLSSSVLVLYFRGRNTGRQFSTPLRYHLDGETVRCFSSEETQWWRNFREANEAHIHLAGKREQCVGKLVDTSSEKRRDMLVNYLMEFPQDAAYHNVRRSHGVLNEDDLDKSAVNCKIVDFSSIQESSRS